MIARRMVTRCSRCGRTFIRSVSGTQSILKALYKGWFGRSEPVLCGKCRDLDNIIDRDLKKYK